MDGFELAEEIRRAFPTLPILLTSGYNDAIKTLQDKGAEFIVKPYRTDELKRKLHDLLDRG
jgi:CheY-like chemotaxis protein